MVKVIIYFTKIIIAVVSSLMLFSCQGNINFGKSIKGSGNVKKEVRSLSGFTKVSIEKGLDCEIHQAPKFAVIVEADDNLINGIKTRVENGVLKITSDYNNYKNVTSKKIIVQMPEIDGLESTSGASLKTESLITGTSVKLKSSSGSDMEVNIESDTITCESTSGSDVSIRGKALQLNIASSSGSSVEAENLLANTVYAQSTSGSSIAVYPILLLDAKASSGSSISYKNTPKELHKENTSAGSVNKD